MENNINLQNGDNFITPNKLDAYLVTSGTLLVYIVPIRKGTIGRRVFVCEASKSSVLPGIAFRDLNYCNWALCFTTVDNASLSILENGCTKKLKKNFCQKLGIENYDVEGFELSIADWYEMNLVKQAGVVKRTQNSRKDISSSSDDIIERAIGNKKNIKFKEKTDSNFNIRDFEYKKSAHFLLHGKGKLEVLFVLIISLMLSVASLILPSVAERSIDFFLVSKNSGLLKNISAIALAFLVLCLLLSLINNTLIYHIKSKTSHKIQERILKKVFNLPLDFFRKNKSSEAIYLLTSASSVIESTIAEVFMAIVCFINIVVMLVKVFSYPKSIVLFGLMLVVACVAVYSVVILGTSEIKKRKKKYDKDTYSTLYQFISGINKIRMAGAEEYVVYEYISRFIDQYSIDNILDKKENYGKTIIHTANILMIFIFIMLVVHHFSITIVGDFISAYIVLTILLTLIYKFIESITQIIEKKPLIDKLTTIYFAKDECEMDLCELERVSGKINIDNVSFSYGEDSKNILENVSININEGDIIGIVGESGCGKSTLIKLIIGFEKVKSGKIYYDNVDIDSINKQTLRRNMGIVLQNDSLIAGSIYENIIAAHPGASREEIKDVIELVGLNEDVGTMPMGLNTMISDGGENISSGQKQRILLARALIGNPKIIILDEATSSLDSESLSNIRALLKSIKATKILIVHDLDITKDCDEVIVMDSGHIVENGTYDELMDNHGTFYNMVKNV